MQAHINRCLDFVSSILRKFFNILLIISCIIWNVGIIIASQEVVAMSTRIKELRQARQMTLLEVSKKLGVSESTVQRYESGAIANLKYETIISLSNLFGVDPCYLMGWDEPAPEPSESISLEDDERQLVEFYRSLNPIGKRKALESVEDLTQIEKYIKISDSDSDAV